MRYFKHFCLNSISLFLFNQSKSSSWKYDKTVLPPTQLLSDNNISLFLTEMWHETSKGTLLNAIKYINYCLATYKLPSITIFGARAQYPSTYYTYEGIKKSPKWRNSITNGAGPLTKLEVKRIWKAPIKDFDDLRHKVITSCYLFMGFHKVGIF